LTVALLILPAKVTLSGTLCSFAALFHGFQGVNYSLVGVESLINNALFDLA
jgi:hypothetical protein